MQSRLIRHLVGVVTGLIVAVATIVLSIDGDLGLYINPSYSLFAIVMAVITVLVLLTGLFSKETVDEHGHFALENSVDNEHSHAIADAAGHSHQTNTKNRMWGSPLQILGASVLLLASAVLFYGIPASALSEDAAVDRGVNQIAQLSGRETNLSLDTSGYDLADWVLYLANTPNLDALANTEITASGFVTPTSDPDGDYFYLTRFLITHCAIDAVPLGLAIYSPGWQDSYQTGKWLELQGNLAVGIGPDNSESHVKPVRISKIEAPADPYVY